MNHYKCKECGFVSWKTSEESPVPHTLGGGGALEEHWKGRGTSRRRARVRDAGEENFDLLSEER